MHFSYALLAASLATVSTVTASPTARSHSATFKNKGLVGYGSIPATAIDSTSDTIGGIGSAAYLDTKSFKKNSDGTFSGVIAAAPDRGWNTQNTIDYHTRHQLIDFTLNPYTGDLAFGAQSSLGVTYQKTLLYKDPYAKGKKYTTGLDPTGVRKARGHFPAVPIASDRKAICIDQEGMALAKDGTFWVSDEYGPHVYHISAKGELLSAIAPPKAILPYDADGNLNFTSTADPATGRAANQGFEGLTITPDSKTLYALLQSATIQDGGSDGLYTRLFEWDIRKPTSPKLTGEWAIELPAASDLSKIYAASEVHYVSKGVFLVLARDGHGNGDGSSTKKLTSAFKNIGIVNTKGATNIANTKYDSPQHPIAVNNTLASGIKASQFKEFISLIDDDQLAKAGLQNGPPADTDITGKFESIVVASVMDKKFPNDYFIMTVADNDFITTNGSYNGISYSDPQALETGNSPTEIMVFRATLPNADTPSFVEA